MFKKNLIALFLFLNISLIAQTFNYNFSSFGGAFTPITTGSLLVHPANTDDAISSAINIGFNFKYNCIDYTTLKISSNGVVFLGNTAIGTNPINNLSGSTDRPAIAPLWDDMQCDPTGQVAYQLTGVSPNQVLTIEWLNMRWGKSQTASVISFQAILYETSSIIDFVYRQEPAAVNGTQGGASIGISGPNMGQFYSLPNTGVAPVPSSAIEISNLLVKPATGQVYRWTPNPITPPLTVYNQNICVGNTATLSVYGGNNTYTWSTAATTSSITVSPLSNTIYTVSSGSGICAVQNTVAVTVSVQPAPPVATPSSFTLCGSGTISANASGSTGFYAWSSSIGGPIISTLTTFVSPTLAANTTYYLAASVSTLNYTSGQTYTFTNAGATGVNGPTQAQINTAYLSTNLNGSVTINPQGIQNFIVPISGVYKITAIGASGGSVTVTCPHSGGLGANMSGEFNLTAGTTLKILVGQMGTTNNSDAGGGGGSFVTDAANNPFVVAGGGGGASNNVSACGAGNLNGSNASIGTSGLASGNALVAGGIGGNGGGASTGAGGGGGGLLTNGTPGSGNAAGNGKAFINGGVGGTGSSTDHGGFGGGGCGWFTGGNGGGGGGYSGGGTSGGSPYTGGGGGGSFNGGANQVNTTAASSGNGYVIVQALAIPQSVCMSTAVPVQVTVNPPTPTISVTNQNICINSAATIIATGAPSYTWDNSATTSSIVVSPTVNTTYTVTSGIAPCADQKTVAVTVSVQPASPVATPSSFTLCGSGTISTNASGSTGFYAWSNSIGGPIISTLTTFVSPTIAVNTTYYLAASVSSLSSTSGQTFTFTNAAATGSLGPTQAQVNTAYASTTLNGSVTIGPQGIQTFVVPVTGTYRIRAAGASANNGASTNFGCKGRIVQQEINLTVGDVIKIAVGQMGTVGSGGSSGGGGGSYVARIVGASTVPVIVGGGGGGQYATLTSTVPNSNGSLLQSGYNSICNTGIGGVGGNGGNGSTGGWGGGGGGFNTNGTAASACASNFGFAFLNGSNGGNTCANAPGGFGGGGATHGNTGGGGGGGGYSGGGGCNQSLAGTNSGGGGGSFFSASATNTLDIGFNIGNGYVTIETIAVPQAVCMSTAVPVQITVNPPTPTISVTNQNICINSTATIIATGAPTYTWDNSATTSSIVVSPTVNTTYTVSSGVAPCADQKTVAVTVSVQPASPVATPSSFTLCGSGTISTNASGSTGFYAWSNSIGGPIISTLTTFVSPSLAVNTTYYLAASVSSLSSTSGQTFTFTNAAATGSLGPTQAQVNTAYASTTLNGSVTIGPQGIQTFVVPVTGTYRIRAAGASANNGASTNFGCKGRIVQQEINLTVGDVIKIAVGQMGTVGSGGSSGGGGGSYVARIVGASTVPVIVGGGGGGQYATLTSTVPNSNGSLLQSGYNSICNTGIGGVGGNGGNGSTGGWGGGGGGFNTNGTAASACASNFGFAFLNGSNGGNTCANAPGGFGGGGATHGNTGGGGGGGGYSGGGGCNQSLAGTNSGGGGGSFFSASATNTLDIGFNIGNGYVTIETIAVPQAVCMSTAVPVQITVNPPTPTLTANNFTVCNPGSATIQASGGTTYTWNTSANTSSIVVSPLVNTVYTVSSGLAPCVGQKTVSGTVLPVPGAPLVTPNNFTLCSPGSTLLTASSSSSVYSWYSVINGTAIATTPTLAVSNLTANTTLYAAVAAATAAASGSQTFTHTGASQIFIVPSGVSSLTITAWGAKGGTGLLPGGNGGAASGIINVTPGQQLNIYVGGTGSLVTGGFNGGGNGGVGSSSTGFGGGGASDVRINGSALSDRKIVAAGGGGVGGNATTYNAGAGVGGAGSACAAPLGVGGSNGVGCAVGTLGGCAGGTAPNYGTGGGGGGLNSGGSLAGSGGGSYGQAGSFGLGGNGGNNAPTYGGTGGGVNGGGGGGAGYYGGAGAQSGNGGCNGGGGGGSSYIDNTLFSSTSFSSGVSAGHGSVTISYNGSGNLCPSPLTTVNIAVVAGPTITALATETYICTGTLTSILSSTGATTYTWLPVNVLSNTVLVTPIVNTTYTVIGDNGSGCPDTETVSIVVCAFLPIELLNFDVRKESDIVKIDWATQSEINNDKFIVERSVNAVNWEFVYETKGAGNSTGYKHYSCIDSKPYLGLSYYRLKQVNFDASYTYSDLRSVRFESSESLFNLIPNPASKSVNVIFNLSGKTKSTIEITDATGRQVLNPIFVQDNSSTLITVPVNITELLPGVYFVTLRENDRTQTRKLIIEN